MATLYTQSYNLQESNLSVYKILSIRKRIQFAFGNSDNGIVFYRLNAQGKSKGAKEILLKNKRLYFSKAIRVSATKFIILGQSSSAGHSIIPHILLVNTKGAILTHKEIRINYIRNIRSLLLLNKKEIFISFGFIGSANSRRDGVCCLKLDMQFNIKNSVKLTIIHDDQYRGAILYGRNILLYGAIAAGRNKGLITVLSSDFKTSSTYVIKDANVIPRIDNAIVDKEKGLLLFGNYIESGKTHLAILNVSLNANGITTHNVKIFQRDVSDIIITEASVYQDYYTCLALEYPERIHYFLTLDSNLNLIKNQTFDFEKYYLASLNQFNDSLQICGNISIDDKHTEGLIIQTNDSFESCRAKDVELKEYWSSEIEFEPVSLKISSIKAEIIEREAQAIEKELNVASRCDVPDPNPNTSEDPYKEVPFHLEGNYKLQSAYLSLQSAGSKGIDSSKGVHLRWLLAGNLGDNHLPKGNHASNNNYFNKPDDFVRIYRVPYNSRQSINNAINLFNEMPYRINDNECIWVYKRNEKTYFLEFENKTKYAEIRGAIGTINSSNKSQNLLTQYGKNIYKFSCKNELCFAVNIIKEQNATLNLEIFSIENKSFAEDIPIISARKSYGASQTLCRVTAENISYIKFSFQINALTNISLECYSDILKIRKNKASFIGAFALEKNTSIVKKRVETNANYTIDNKWHKFESTQKVKIKNYVDRWQDDDFGLGKGVNDYISLSDVDPKAIEEYVQSDALYGNDKDESKMDVSYLNFIQLASLDYINAVMLGLGYIDSYIKEDQQYIYFAEYKTLKELENYDKPKYNQHIYFSLPTGIGDQRLPQRLTMQPIIYGLKIDNATSKPLLITDEEGYAFKMKTRYINLKAQLQTDLSISNSFFNPNIEFESSTFSNPVFVGFKNKKNAATAWKKPDLLHENDFYSDNGNTLNENALALFTESSSTPNYIHAVITEGVDHYSAYPVNLFLRTGELSNEVSTDTTKFKVENTLMPPSNINVHLIQEEGLPMLTTKDEQDWLENINGDKTLVRLIFDYNHVQEKNYAWGDKIRIFHSKKFPDNVIGGIKNIYDDTDSKYCFVETKDFYYHSTGETLTPKIDPVKYDNYKGSLLSFASEKFEVVEIIPVNTDGSYPTIKLKKNEIRDSHNIGTATNPKFQLSQVYKGPELSSSNAFLLVENYSNTISWKDIKTPNENKLTFEIELLSQTEKTETYIDEQGNPNDITVRGIWDDCKITHHPMVEYLKDKDDIRVKDDDGHDIVISEYAYYKIEFNNTILDYHPQFIAPDNNSNTSSVDWYKGTIRVHAINDSTGTKARKVLKIDEIQNVGTIPPQKLILIASDLSYSNQVNKINSNDSINYQDKRIQIANIAPEIKIGSNVSVNYYPSYKVYLRSDNAALFNETTILPEIGKGEQKTLIGLQTIDYDVLDKNSIPYSSPVGVPAIIFGNELIKLEQPDLPTGPLFATPPNFYGKAQYSFKTKFKAKPWGVVFFRSDINRILSVLYSRVTLKEIILPRILPIRQDEHFIDRWQNLLAIDCDINGNFNEYLDAEGNPFAFPNPDGSDFDRNLMPGSDEWKDQIEYLLSTCMLPLTEHPIIFEFVKGENHVPLPKKQNLRDNNGKILHPNNDEFDMAPMAKRISDKEILFTDFTLDGNMDKNTAYVYSVREMNKALKFGKASDFLGPVQLVNTTPPNPLVIKNLTVKLPTYENDFKSSVLFEVNKIANSQNIDKIQIFRLNNSVDALNPRNIEPIKEIGISDIDTSGYTFIVEDDFSDLDQVPYGVPIYYNLVGVRKVEYIDHNGNDITEFVSSKSSKTIVTNVIDMSTPEEPILLDPISFNIIPATGSVSAQITNIEFKWNKCCYNGKYFISILNEFNNWELIETIESNDSVMTFNYNSRLPQFNEDDEIIYYKFKIEVENTVGIRNESSIFSILY